MRSDSDSKPQTTGKRGHAKRRRLLKRGCSYEPFTIDHIKYLWAAYRDGTFVVPGQQLEPSEFKEFIQQWAAECVSLGNDWHVMIAPTKLGIIPVGIVSSERHETDEMAVQYTPSMIWFSQSSLRNRLETTVKFLIDLKKKGNVTFICLERDWPFFQHVCNYGVLRPVGKLWKHYKDGSDAMMYRCVR